MPHPCNNSSRLLSLNVMYLYCYVCVINDGYVTVLKLNTYYDKNTFELVQACPKLHVLLDILFENEIKLAISCTFTETSC